MFNVQSVPETSVLFLFSSKDMSLLKEIVLNSDFDAYVYIYICKLKNTLMFHFFAITSYVMFYQYSVCN